MIILRVGNDKYPINLIENSFSLKDKDVNLSFTEIETVVLSFVVDNEDFEISIPSEMIESSNEGKYFFGKKGESNTDIKHTISKLDILYKTGDLIAKNIIESQFLNYIDRRDEHRKQEGIKDFRIAFICIYLLIIACLAYFFWPSLNNFSGTTVLKAMELNIAEDTLIKVKVGDKVLKEGLIASVFIPAVELRKIELKSYEQGISGIEVYMEKVFKDDIQLTATMYNLQLQLVASQLEIAKITLERGKQLLSSGIGLASDVETAKLKVSELDASIKKTKVLIIAIKEGGYKVGLVEMRFELKKLQNQFYSYSKELLALERLEDINIFAPCDCIVHEIRQDKIIFALLDDQGLVEVFPVVWDNNPATLFSEISKGSGILKTLGSDYEVTFSPIDRTGSVVYIGLAEKIYNSGQLIMRADGVQNSIKQVGLPVQLEFGT